MKIRRMASLKTADEFQKYLRENNITLPFAENTAALNARINSTAKPSATASLYSRWKAGIAL